MNHGHRHAAHWSGIDAMSGPEFVGSATLLTAAARMVPPRYAGHVFVGLVAAAAIFLLVGMVAFAVVDYGRPPAGSDDVQITTTVVEPALVAPGVVTR